MEDTQLLSGSAGTQTSLPLLSSGLVPHHTSLPGGRQPDGQCGQKLESGVRRTVKSLLQFPHTLAIPRTEGKARPSDACGFFRGRRRWLGNGAQGVREGASGRGGLVLRGALPEVREGGSDRASQRRVFQQQVRLS